MTIVDFQLPNCDPEQSWGISVLARTTGIVTAGKHPDPWLRSG
jgi:hypothetical protein